MMWVTAFAIAEVWMLVLYLYYLALTRLLQFMKTFYLDCEFNGFG